MSTLLFVSCFLAALINFNFMLMSNTSSVETASLMEQEKQSSEAKNSNNVVEPSVNNIINFLLNILHWPLMLPSPLKWTPEDEFAQCCDDEGFRERTVRHACRFPPHPRTFSEVVEIGHHFPAFIGCYAGHSDNRAAYGTVLLELLIDLVGFPISALNFYAIYRTSVIHRNLKFILLCQSAAYMMRFGIKLGISMPNRLIGGNILWHESQQRLVYFVFFSNAVFRHLLGHVIVLERTMATLLATNYEQSRNNLFSACWFSFLICWALLNATSQQLTSSSVLEAAKVTTITLTCSYVVLSLALVDIGVFIYLWLYNKRMHGHVNPKKFDGNQYALTKRYQQLENIRTGLQLVPTLVCHFLYVLDAVLSQTMLAFKWLPNKHYEQFELTVVNMLDAVFAVSAELTIIIFHPFLKRDILKLFNKFLRRNQVIDVHNSAAEISTHYQQQMKKNTTGGGGGTAAIDDHFEMLKNCWERK